MQTFRKHIQVFIVILTMILSANLRAQIYEVGPYIGGSNFIGDVGATNYINPNSLAFGGIVKWNKSLRHSWRLSLIHTSLKADDADSNQGFRKERGYHFSNSLTELSVGLEFNFWDWDIYSDYKKITPYLATGISGFLTNEFSVEGEMDTDPPRGYLERKGNKFGFAVPMIIGVKGNISRNLVLSLEVGARLAFFDNFDGSDTRGTFDDGITPRKFGASNNTDWYMFSGISLTYAFGRKECYDVY